MGGIAAHKDGTHPIDRLLWNEPEFPHSQHYTLCALREILVDDMSVVRPLFVGETVLVDDLHLFHNC